MGQSGLHTFQAVIMEICPSFPTVIRPLMSPENCMYRNVYGPKIYKYFITIYLCVSCDSQNREKIFPYTAITSPILLPIWRLFIERQFLAIYKKQFTVTHKMTVPWLRRLVADFWRPKFEDIPSRICGGKMWHYNIFFLGSSILPFQYYSAKAL